MTNLSKPIKKPIFSFIQILLSLTYIPVVIIIFSISLIPGLFISDYIYSSFIISNTYLLMRLFLYGCTISITYILFGITQLFLVGAAYRIFPFKIKEGKYPFRSTMCLKWAFNSSLLKLVKLTFLDFITPSFLNILFFKMMGGKIGKNVQINSVRISDPWLLNIKDGAMIGGDANINGHTFENNNMIFKRVEIGHKATIGASSIIWPNTIVGNHSTLATKSLLLKDTKIPDNEVWGGVPAKFLKQK